MRCFGQIIAIFSHWWNHSFEFLRTDSLYRDNCSWVNLECRRTRKEIESKVLNNWGLRGQRLNNNWNNSDTELLPRRHFHSILITGFFPGNATVIWIDYKKGQQTFCFTNEHWCMLRSKLHKYEQLYETSLRLFTSVYNVPCAKYSRFSVDSLTDCFFNSFDTSFEKLELHQGFITKYDDILVTSLMDWSPWENNSSQSSIVFSDKMELTCGTLFGKRTNRVSSISLSDRLMNKNDC